MDLKALASVLLLPAIAYGRAPVDFNFDEGIDLLGSGAVMSMIGDMPQPDPLGEEWVFISFPDEGVYSFTDIITEGSRGWQLLQGYGGTLDDFTAIPVKTESPTPGNGGIILLVPARSRCAGDFNDDGVVNIYDPLDFFDAYDQGDLAADLNHDGELGIYDIIAFIDAFATGCD